MWGTDPWDNCPEAAGAASTPSPHPAPREADCHQEAQAGCSERVGGGDRLGVGSAPDPSILPRH